MKVYILFKARDMSQKKKEFIIDKIFTSYQGAARREERLHEYNRNSSTPMREELGIGHRGLLETETQQTYIINKSVKGLLTGAKKAEKKNKIKIALNSFKRSPSFITSALRRYKYEVNSAYDPCINNVILYSLRGNHESN